MVKNNEIRPEVEAFIANMAAVRRALHLSQRGLARISGYRPSDISDIENGRRKGITLRIASDIARALGVPLSLLVSTRRVNRKGMIHPLDDDPDQLYRDGVAKKARENSQEEG